MALEDSGNQGKRICLLAALTPADRALLAPHFTELSFELRLLFQEAGSSRWFSISLFADSWHGIFLKRGQIRWRF
ncbi:MAG: hypothetical protein ACLQFI_17800 [Methylocella sp.]|jgi:hypothetical protein